MRSPRRPRRVVRRARLAAVTLAAACVLAPATAAAAPGEPATYRNPLPITIPGSSGRVQTFADPAVIRGRDDVYYAYATSDPLGGDDRDASGALRTHRIPMARSTDLVHWTYAGDAFDSVPAWLAPTSGIWAPDVRYIDGAYHLYYTATDVTDLVSGEPGCDGDSAIGVATAPTPTGPWTDSGGPVVAPRRNGPGCDFKWTFDPDVLATDDGLVIYYGSYRGGVEARRLSADGRTSDPASARQIVTEERYEGSYVIRHGGFYWYFGSATDCCRGPLTGYSVFTGRSKSPFGPFRDREGNALIDTRVGGTPVISMNGNRWVGTGHNAVITDTAGQDWFVYHAIDRTRPYLSGENPDAINRRPMLMDRLTWREGWPSVRSGRWASDTPQPAPVTAHSGARSPEPPLLADDRPGTLLTGPSDEFDGSRPEAGWRWIRTPVPDLGSVAGHIVLPTDAGDIFEDSNSAPLLVRDAPRQDFMVETRFTFDVPATGVFNFQQAGIALMQDDDAFVKLAHVAIATTRQTEWAKEVPAPVTPRNQRYGNTVIGPPALPDVTPSTTWLRIVKRTLPRTGEQRYTGYSSIDGRTWVRGGTWTHDLKHLKIALFAFGGVGHRAAFGYVRVRALAPFGGGRT